MVIQLRKLGCPLQQSRFVFLLDHDGSRNKNYASK